MASMEWLRKPVVAYKSGCDTASDLHCPRCGGEYLHQRKVMVFDRGEDDELTAVTTVQGGLSATHLLPSAEADNPSSRRQGLAISFECEYCHGEIELTIAQHKGLTQTSWRYEEGGGGVAD
jgi:hypothetical protein